MAEQSKKIIEVEVLHLGEKGYGPEGEHTREQWRAECLEYLLKGKNEFIAWQKSWETQTLTSNAEADFTIKVSFNDGDSIEIGNSIYKSKSHTLDFSGYESLEVSNLSSYQFFFDVTFELSTFIKPISFAKTIFHERNVFQHVVFGKTASFNQAKFIRSSLFNKATFKQNADFLNADFMNAIFVEVCFDGAVYFNETQFRSIANFSKSIFNSEAYFNKVMFTDEAKFIGAEFNFTSYFIAARFHRRANFEAVKLAYVGHFEDAWFIVSPTFLGVKIDSTRVQFSDDEYLMNIRGSSSQIANDVGFLKRLSEEHGQIDQALNFNAIELRIKRKIAWNKLRLDTHTTNLYKDWPKLIEVSWRSFVSLKKVFKGDFWFCFFTWLYEHVADFGRSYTKPLFYLILLFFISYLFGIVSAFENSPSLYTHSRQAIFSELSRSYPYDHIDIKLSGYRAATEYSLYRSGNFLDFTDTDTNTEAVNMRLFGQQIEPWWARIFGFFKGIFTTVLLFLTALGLRNKYRVG